MKNIPVTKGTIQTRPVTPLTNKLVVYVSWHEKDHTDSDFYEEVLEITKTQWDEILEKNLIGKTVDFKILINEHELNLVEIIFPKKIYSEEEVYRLVQHAWHEGFRASRQRDGFSNPNTWWQTNKK
jgi:hypothetical protein